ncbi:MAG: valine--tRNA ligase [Candidatus Gracilibacteria bacterium]|jgi:valyl-tRNA synthetase|nr:valine--tRNA ligase [Candidatus Gracilibacteria bacterium]
MEKNYDPQKVEQDIYKKWESAEAFKPSKEGDSYTIAIPPPNVTGTLHLGHAIMLAVEDTLIRYKRMKGHSALWIPGTDHAAIATENVVLKNIGAKSREEFSREEFLNHCQDWTKKSHARITEQIRRMGSSCDWSREAYTFDNERNHAVNTIFEMLYNDGLIVRGERMVNWSVGAESVLSDDELDWKEQQSPLYYIKYGPFTLATVRPETKFGDTAIAVNPKDPRYQEWIGKEVEIDTVLGKSKLKVISDDYVDMEFGTGVVKITPAHDPNDFEIGKRHKLEIKQVIEKNGKMNHHAGKFAGMDRFEARKKIIAEMKTKGLIEKIDENYINRVAYCYRSNTVVEPMLSKQWFIAVEKEFTDKFTGQKTTLKKLTQEAVRQDHIQIIPERFEKIYFNWIDNLKDWCISRQIWWGHRIPVWYCDDCEAEIVSSPEIENCPNCQSKNLKQDEDTLDTWFSSALWPFSVLGWPNEKHSDFNKFYPTDVLETGHDILFFWVARMIMFGRYATGKYPFHTVYLHGLVCDSKGQKMSKSKGNGIDPLDMIERFGTDAVRLSLMIGTTPGNNVNLGEEKISGCRNFCNKLWNIARFITMQERNEELGKLDTDLQKWIYTLTQNLIKEVEEDIAKYRLGEALQKLWDFTWNELADWAVEAAKAENNTQTNTVIFETLKTLLRLLHPFIPFVTEQIWSEIGKKDMLIANKYPQSQDIFKELDFETVKNVITQIRSIRAEHKVEPAKKITAYIGGKTEIIKNNESILKFLARIETVKYNKQEEEVIHSFVDGVDIILPMSGMIDKAKEAQRKAKEIKDAKKKLAIIESKLSNKGFTEKAPKELIEKTKKEQQELTEKIKNL